MADGPGEGHQGPRPDGMGLPLPGWFEGANSPAQAELWIRWYRKFSRYRFASGLHVKSEREQVETLLYAMGDSADDLLTMLHIDEDHATYEEVTGALNAYFHARKSIIVERAKFNRRSQGPGEPVEQFMQDLHRLADDCEYGLLRDQLIRDCIVVGVLEDGLSDKLQARADLTLVDAMRIARQEEARKQDRAMVRGQKGPGSVDYVKATGQTRRGKSEAKGKRQSQRHSRHSEDKPCKWCGGAQHDHEKCPARDKSCNKCKKKGHFAIVCRGHDVRLSKVHEVGGEEIPFLGEIHGQGDCWSAEIIVNGFPTTFKLDTGAAVSVLSDQAPLLEHCKINKHPVKLTGPGGVPLPVIGTLKASLAYRDAHIKETMYVLRNQQVSLLSKSACVTLGLVSRIDEVGGASPATPNFIEEFPDLFEGLGKLQEEHHITLRQEVQPVCLYTARRVPHPLLPQVKKELEAMVEQQVISPVTGPTSWCSGMVPVPKLNGRIRICIDLTLLNRAVRREVHPMRSVDENLAKLGGSVIYSKLDGNSGFWQIPLDDESKLLTTFISPFGRFCFNRLPFGISSAPEIYQRMMSSVLQGLEGEGVICHMDDVLIHGHSEAEHNERVRQVLERLREAGLTLNEKCEFSRKEIRFLGHIISVSGIRADPRGNFSRTLPYTPSLYGVCCAKTAPGGGVKPNSKPSCSFRMLLPPRRS